MAIIPRFHPINWLVSYSSLIKTKVSGIKYRNTIKLKNEKTDFPRACLTICDLEIGVKRRALSETTGIG
jgi:hypothetical protein